MSEQEQPDDGAVEQPQESRTPVTQILGRVIIVVLILIFLVFAAANGQHVDFSWVLGETRARFDGTGGHIEGGVRLIFLLTATFFLGILVGAMLSWLEFRRKRREARKAL